jgi:uncharacterized membrane protein YccC
VFRTLVQSGAIERLLDAAVRVDRAGLQPVRGGRYGLGVGAPLLVGVATGRLVEGVAVAGGAVLVGLTDSGAPYRRRVPAMLGAAFAVALSTFIGELIGARDVVAVIVLAAWSFAAGMFIAGGLATYLVALMGPVAMVAAASVPANASDALARALLVFGGGLVQIGLVLITWRLHPDRPERLAVARVYWALAGWVGAGIDDRAPVFSALQRARTVLGDDGEELSTLVEIADRTFGDLIALRDAGIGSPQAPEALAAVAGILLHRRGQPTDPPPNPPTELLDQALALAAAATVRTSANSPASLHRGVGDVAAAVRANLTVRSSALRHAVRLAVTVAVADALQRALQLPHGYWVPLTVLWLLRPDFGATFTRGLQRYAGTVIGAVLATLLVASLHPDPYALAVLATFVAAGILTFLQANYALTAICTTAWVVFVSSLAGIPELRAAADRLLDTSIGATLALGFYLLWPTWERAAVGATVAEVIEQDRRYTVAVLAAWLERGPSDPGVIRRAKADSRVTRCNAEAALQRALIEPSLAPRGLDPGVAGEVLAAMRRFCDAPLALERTESQQPPLGPRAREFAATIDAALAQLVQAADLGRAPEALPRLHDDHGALVGELGPSAPLMQISRRMVTAIDDVARALRHVPEPQRPAACLEPI